MVVAFEMFETEAPRTLILGSDLLKGQPQRVRRGLAVLKIELGAACIAASSSQQHRQEEGR